MEKIIVNVVLLITIVFVGFVNIANAQSVLIKNNHELSDVYKTKDGKIILRNGSTLIPDTRYFGDGKYCFLKDKNWVCPERR